MFWVVAMNMYEEHWFSGEEEQMRKCAYLSWAHVTNIIIIYHHCKHFRIFVHLSLYIYVLSLLENLLYTFVCGLTPQNLYLI